jgi:hypothetical protein
MFFDGRRVVMDASVVWRTLVLVEVDVLTARKYTTWIGGTPRCRISGSLRCLVINPMEELRCSISIN